MQYAYSSASHAQLQLRSAPASYGFLVVLEVTEILIAQRAIFSSDTHTVVWISADLRLVDQVAHDERVLLSRAEHERLLFRIDHRHEQANTMGFALADFNDAIEVTLLVQPASLDLAFDQVIVRRENILVERRRDLFHLKWREESIVDAVLKRSSAPGRTRPYLQTALRRTDRAIHSIREREPQLIRPREARLLSLAARLHIDAVDTAPVRREGMTDR